MESPPFPLELSNTVKSTRYLNGAVSFANLIAIVTIVVVVNLVGYVLTCGGRYSFAASTCTCTNIANCLWDHTCGKTDHAGIKICLKDSGDYITMTGTVYGSGGTPEEPDGDPHFTLQLDPQYGQYSNKHDPQCTPPSACSIQCINMIVEVLCHDRVDPIYIKQFGDYCKGVNNVFQGKPHQGDQLSIIGRWVQNLDHTVSNPNDPLNEIHPASNIHKIQLKNATDRRLHLLK